VITHWVLPQLVCAAPPSLPRVCALGKPPGTAGEAPGTAGEAPGTAGEAPGTAREAPGTAREAPGTAREGPGTAREGPNSAREGCGAVPAFGRDLPAQFADLQVVTGLVLSAVTLWLMFATERGDITYQDV